MLYGAIFPGRYIQGKNALTEIETEVLRFGKKGFFICSPGVNKNIFPKIESNFQNLLYAKDIFTGETTETEIERLVSEAKKNGCDVICGLGGGKTLDTAKAVACNLDVPVIIAPTIASTDAPTSAIAVIYTEEGIFKRVLCLKNNPNVVLVDTEIIVNAPVRFLISGMGDALATFFEAEACRQKSAKNFAGFNGLLTGYKIAELCYQTLLNYGKLAIKSAELKIVTPALEHIVEANTLLSGIGFESCGIATAHSIHNGFTVMPETRKYFHGEKVAFGTLASLFLTDKKKSIIDEVYKFCIDVRLPVTLEQLGLKNIKDDDIMKIAEKSCAEGELIINEPFEVKPESVFSAIKLADAYGKNIKAI